MKHLLVFVFSILALFYVTNLAYVTKENHVFAKPNFLESSVQIHSIIRPNYFSDPDNSIYSLKYKQYEYFIPYKISNSTIERMNLSCMTSSLSIYLQDTGNGNLTVSIPRQMLSSKAGYDDSDFIVLLDKEEIKSEETEPYTGSRTLNIPFAKDSKLIEIIATQWLSNSSEYPQTCVTVDSDESIYYLLLLPLQQFKSGIPIDKIQCKEGLQLVFKYTTDASVCVTYPTGVTLIKRGWGTCVGHEDYHRGTPCGFSSSTDGG